MLAGYIKRHFSVQHTINQLLAPWISRKFTRESIENALGRKGVLFIHGPVGAGKSVFLNHLIYHELSTISSWIDFQCCEVDNMYKHFHKEILKEYHQRVLSDTIQFNNNIPLAIGPIKLGLKIDQNSAIISRVEKQIERNIIEAKSRNTQYLLFFDHLERVMARENACLFELSNLFQEFISEYDNFKFVICTNNFPLLRNFVKVNLEKDSIISMSYLDITKVKEHLVSCGFNLKTIELLKNLFGTDIEPYARILPKLFDKEEDSCKDIIINEYQNIKTEDSLFVNENIFNHLSKEETQSLSEVLTLLSITQHMPRSTLHSLNHSCMITRLINLQLLRHYDADSITWMRPRYKSTIGFSPPNFKL